MPVGTSTSTGKGVVTTSTSAAAMSATSTVNTEPTTTSTSSFTTSSVETDFTATTSFTINKDTTSSSSDAITTVPRSIAETSSIAPNSTLASHSVTTFPTTSIQSTTVTSSSSTPTSVAGTRTTSILLGGAFGGGVLVILISCVIIVFVSYRFGLRLQWIPSDPNDFEEVPSDSSSSRPSTRRWTPIYPFLGLLPKNSRSELGSSSDSRLGPVEAETRLGQHDTESLLSVSRAMTSRTSLSLSGSGWNDENLERLHNAESSFPAELTTPTSSVIIPRGTTRRNMRQVSSLISLPNSRTLTTQSSYTLTPSTSSPALPSSTFTHSPSQNTSIILSLDTRSPSAERTGANPLADSPLSPSTNTPTASFLSPFVVPPENTQSTANSSISPTSTKATYVPSPQTPLSDPFADPPQERLEDYNEVEDSESLRRGAWSDISRSESLGPPPTYFTGSQDSHERTGIQGLLARLDELTPH